MRRYTRKGAPNKEVNILIGISVVVILLATVSAINKIMAPTAIVNGIIFDISSLANDLTICGASIPIQLIRPATDTTEDTKRVAENIAIVLIHLTFTPKSLA